MNIFASFRYQMADQKKGIMVYYGVLFGMYVLIETLFVFLFPPQKNMSSMNGVTGITVIFLFVASLCSFKGNFGMCLQNGVSRRSLFLGRLCTAGAVCLITAVLDEALTLLVPLFSTLLRTDIVSYSLFENVYGGMLGDSLNPFLMGLCSMAFSFSALLAAAGLGYFITILFYRLNKLGKILVGAGVPGFFMVGVPLLKMLNERIAGGKIGEALVRFISSMAEFLVGQPQNAMLTYLALFAMFSLFAWLLMRRAVVK